MGTTLLLEALHRHLPRSPLWKARDQWVKAIADLATLRRSFSDHWQKRTAEALIPMLPGRTDIEWASGLWLAAERAAANQSLDDMAYQEVATATGRTLDSLPGMGVLRPPEAGAAGGLN